MVILGFSFIVFIVRIIYIDKNFVIVYIVGKFDY